MDLVSGRRCGGDERGPTVKTVVEHGSRILLDVKPGVFVGQIGANLVDKGWWETVNIGEVGDDELFVCASVMVDFFGVVIA